MSAGRRVFSFAVLIFTFAALSLFTYAQETPETKGDSADRTKVEGRQGRMGRGGRSGFRGDRGMRIGRRGGMIRGLHKLNLTEPQQSQIKTLKETHKIGQQPLRVEMRALGEKFRDGTATEDDKARAGELRTQYRESTDQLRNSIMAVLTPEQVQQLEAMKAEKARKMEERRQRWMERKQQQTPQPPVKTDN